MTGGEPDRFDEQLSDSALDDLFHKSLEPGGDSVQKLLLDFMQDEWRELAERSRVRHQRPMPNQEDAFNAFSAIKISIAKGSGKRDRLLPDPSNVSKLTAAEIKKYLGSISLKYWLIGLGCIGGLLAAAFQFGVWFGRIFPP